MEVTSTKQTPHKHSKDQIQDIMNDAYKHGHCMLCSHFKKENGIYVCDDTPDGDGCEMTHSLKYLDHWEYWQYMPESAKMMSPRTDDDYQCCGYDERTDLDLDIFENTIFDYIKTHRTGY